MRATAQTSLVLSSAPTIDAVASRLARLAAALLGAPAACVIASGDDATTMRALVGDEALARRLALPAAAAVLASGTALARDIASPAGAVAAVPLRLDASRVAAMLCVADCRARQWGDDALASLVELVALAGEDAGRDARAAAAAESVAVLDAVSDAVAAIGADWRIRYFNRMAARIYGASVESVVGRDLFELDPQLIGTAFEEIFRRAMTERVPAGVEAFYPPKGRWLLVRAYPSRDGIVIYSQDVSARRAAEAERRAGEERLRRIADANIVGITVLDRAGRIYEANDEYLRLIGRTRAELQSGTVTRETVSAPEFAAADREAMDRIQRTGACPPYEKAYVRSDGARVPVLVGAAALDEAGERFVGFSVDLSDRDRAEDARRESEARYKLLFDANPRPVWVYDLETLAFLAVNPAAIRLYGYSEAEFLAMTLRDIRPHEDLSRLLDRVATVDKRAVAASEWRHRTRDGRQIEVLINSHALEFEGRSARLVLIEDITERKRAEAALRLSEERYRQMFEQNGAVQLLIDPESGAIVDVNLAAAEFYGHSADAMRAMNIAQINTAPIAELFERMAMAKRGQAANGGFVFDHRLASGALRQVEVHSGPIAAGGRTLLYSIVHDVTERRRAEDALRRSEERYRSIARVTNSMIYDWDVTTGEFHRNEAVYSTFGYRPELVEASSAWWNDHIHPADRDATRARVAEAMASSASGWMDEYRFLRADGAYALVQDRGYVMRDANGRPVRVIGTVTDVTEHRQLEEQFRQAQKMEAVGRLAGGIAHDFNNLLTAIKGFSQLSLSSLAPDADAPVDLSDIVRDLTEIDRAATRAARLTSQLLAFSRKQTVQPRAIDLDACVAGVEPMLRRLIGADIEIIVAPGARGARAIADSGQLEQVLLNLAINARDAMPDGGALTIATWPSAPPESGVRRAAPAQAEGCLALTVTDTGCGMDAATRERIFEPFFTTKAAGQGTGLGLSTVYGIVQQAGGHITVESESGRGTTFTIYLPRSDDAAQPVRESPAAAARKLLAGTETILIAEDETSVRQLAEQVLRSHGYTVLVAGGGAEALRLAAAHEGSIHLLLADVVMPGLGGPQLADRLRELRPATRVLFMSGYTAGAILRGATPDTPAALLEKPFGPDDLARRVREVLDGERS